MRPIGRGATIHALDKPGGGVRWLTVLSAADEDRYDRLVRWALGGSRARKSADRAPLPGPRPVPRKALADARRAWVGEVTVRAAAFRHPVLIRSDVQDCYPSIGAVAVGHGLARLGVPTARIRPVQAAVSALHAHGTRGLAVGPSGSARLADVVLSLADDAVRDAGAVVVRWVDDVVLVAEGPRAAGRAWDAWASRLCDLGLRPHEGKTFVARGADAWRVVVGGTSPRGR